MAVRYSQYMTNLAGEMWKVDILDSDHTGSVSEFILQDFELRYKALSNRWESVWGSECSVFMLSNSDFDLDTLMDDVLSAEEGRFQIALYKKATAAASWNFEWLGLVLNDLSGGSDEGPTQSYNLTATDGIAALKGVDFNIDSVTPVGDNTVIYMLIYALKKLPTSNYWSNTDIFFKAAINYFESQMASINGSPLFWTRLKSSSFYTIDKNGVYKFKNCYEVIELICSMFYGRLWFAGGVWRLFDVRTMETTNNVSYRNVLFDVSLGTSGTETIRHTIDGTWANGSRLAGQVFEYFPALKKLSRVYNHETSRNLANGLVVNTSTANQLVIASIAQTGTDYLAISGVLGFTASENPVTITTKQVYVKVKMKLEIGGYKLKRTVSQASENTDYSNMIWGSASDSVEFIGVFTSTVQGQGTLSIDFETPVFPNFILGSLYIQLEKVYIQDLSGTDISGSYNYSAQFNSLYIEYVDGDAENVRTYEVDNPTTAFLSSLEELPATNFGDKISGLTYNRFEVWNGSAWVDSEGNWKRGAINGTTNLIELVLSDVIAGQRKAIKKRSGSFVGSFMVSAVLFISNEYYMPLDVQYSCKDAQYSGMWYKIGEYNDSDLSIGTVVQTFENVGNPPSVFSGTTNTVLSARGFALPTMTSNELLQLQNVKDGTLMFLTDTKSLVIYSERWETIIGEPVEMVDTDENNAVDTDEDGGIVY